MTLISVDAFSAEGLSRPSAEAWHPMTFPFRRFAHRPAASDQGARTRPHLTTRRFTVNIAPDTARPMGLAESSQAPAPLPPGAPVPGRQLSSAEIQAVASFLIDAAHGLVPAATLARMIGRFFVARTARGTCRSATVSLSGSDGAWAMARVSDRKIEVEETGFGAAHILHEDGTLGLYILEIAPGREIPPHAHQVMREFELVLDDGLLQQDRPVAAGLAFEWPRGHVHAYRNPTDRPLSVLCIDSPRFLPEDEVALTDKPPLVPLPPIGNYFA